MLGTKNGTLHLSVFTEIQLFSACRLFLNDVAGYLLFVAMGKLKGALLSKKKKSKSVCYEL